MKPAQERRNNGSTIMTNETAIKLAAEITVATVQHMADEASMSFDETLAAITAGGNARLRFDAFLEIAVYEAHKALAAA